MNIEILPAKEHEIKDAHTIRCEAREWQLSTGKPDAWSEITTSVERVQNDFDKGVLYLVRLDSEIVGTVALDLEDAYKWGDQSVGEALYIKKLAVKRSIAGNGFGEAVIKWAEEQVRRKGRRYLRFDCFESLNRLRQYYIDQGFKECGVVDGPTQKRPMMRFEKEV